MFSVVDFLDKTKQDVLYTALKKYGSTTTILHTEVANSL